MNKVQSLWVKNLRTKTAYAASNFTCLRDGRGDYSPFGLLCELYRRYESENHAWEWTGSGYVFGGETKFLPGIVQKWVGLMSPRGTFFDAWDRPFAIEGYSSLYNFFYPTGRGFFRTKVTFEQVANCIEDYPAFLFEKDE